MFVWPKAASVEDIDIHIGMPFVVRVTTFTLKFSTIAALLFLSRLCICGIKRGARMVPRGITNPAPIRSILCLSGALYQQLDMNRSIFKGFNPQNISRGLMSHWKTSMDKKFRYKFGHWLISKSYIGHIDISATMAREIIGEPNQSYDKDSSIRSFTWISSKRPRICILGGGFGGLYTALRLESLTWPADKKPQVLLVDQSDKFVFKPMLYEILSGEVAAWEIAPFFSEMLSNTTVQFYKDKVKFISPCDSIGGNGLPFSGIGGTVYLESGVQVEYDWLVLALGAEANLDIVPGALQFSLPFSSLEDARKVDMQLRTLERETFGKEHTLIHVVVVGAGYSGVELAATVAERLEDRGKVQVVDMASTICPSAPTGNREVALKVLSTRNVELFLGYFVSSIRKTYGSEELCTSEETPVRNRVPMQQRGDRFILDLQPVQRGSQPLILETDLVLWTVGVKPQIPLVEPSFDIWEFPVNGKGQAETDETLQVKGHPRIFAIGDSAGLRDPSDRPIPTTAQVAIQQADFAGWNLWAAINNRPLLPFRFQNLGEMMTLGKNDAAVTPSFIDGLTLDGPIAHTARKLAYLYRLPTNEHRTKVGLSWFAKSAVDSIASVQSAIANILAR